VFSNYLTFGEGPRDALMVNNADWLLPLNYLEFLRDVGQHFSVNRMLSFDSASSCASTASSRCPSSNSTT
jgi:tyrosyl-tRNA synthetase